MPRPVADGHLLASAEAWPFLSEVAFAEAITQLGQTTHGLLDSPTQLLANDLEETLRNQAGGRSLDVLASLRDHAWFEGAPGGKVSLVAHLARLGRRVVEPDGERAVLARDGDVAERLGHHRWLSLLLPSDLLIAGRYATMPGFSPPADHLSLCTPSLSAMLHEAPVAETHVHLGACLPFELLWTGLIGSLRAQVPQASDLRDEKGIPFGSAQRLVEVCTAAMITRLLLARFLQEHGRDPQQAFLAASEKILSAMADTLERVSGERAGPSMLRHALRTMFTGRLPPELAAHRLSGLYCRLAGPPPPEPITALDELARRDPLASWLPPGPGRALPETRFLTRSLAYLLGAGADDDPFARLFWQYVRVRCMVFRYLVQQPGTSGLDWFKRHYDRIKPLRSTHKHVLFESGLRMAGRDLRLGVFEGRTAPDPRWSSIRDDVRSAARQALKHPTKIGMTKPEVGLLLHFLKESQGDGKLHADPRQLAHGMRFGAWAKKRLDEAIAIEGLLAVHPEMLVLLRGLDVASTELSVPTWPLVPVFHRVRDASRKAADRLARMQPGLGARALRVTCHVGEDYRRLTEGLRRVHELVAADVLLAGDRVGHGLALGHAPATWAEGASVSYQPLEDRLDDLLWELDCASSGEMDCQTARLEFVKTEAARLAARMYQAPKSWTIHDLREARRLRHDAGVLTGLGFPYMRRPRENEPPARELLVAYLSDTGAFLRGRESIKVATTPDEVRFLQCAQAWLRQTLAAREITIESNPSSNLLIGDFLSIADLPFFQLQPFPGMPDPGGVRLPLSVNSDDPVSFATSLADEYAHLYGALLRQKVGSAQALDWLRARRDEGYRSRFTLPASADGRVLAAISGSGPWAAGSA